MKKPKTNRRRKRISDTFKTIMMGTAMNVAGQLTKPVVDMAVQMIKSHTTYRISLKHEMYIMATSIPKYFKTIPQNVVINVWKDDPVEIVPRRGYRDSDNYVGITMYKGIPIMLRIKMADQDRNTDANDQYELITIRNQYCIDALHEFISELTYEAKKWITMYTQNHRSIEKCIDGRRGVTIDWGERSFDDVFLPEMDKKRLMGSIDAYINNREFYTEHNIPNHFGILLHGPSGTGKSSLASAIAHYANASMYVLNGDQIKELPDILTFQVYTRPTTEDTYRVVVIEDIDSGMFALNRENWNASSKTVNTSTTGFDDEGKLDTKNVGIATILNTIDGTGAPTNVIYVFTTNHIEMLDPAFLRPGRCDLVMEVKPVCVETMKQFLSNFYATNDIPEIHSVKEGISFAELQTKVMMGWSMKQLVDEYCNV